MGAGERSALAGPCVCLSPPGRRPPPSAIGHAQPGPPSGLPGIHTPWIDAVPERLGRQTQAAAGGTRRRAATVCGSMRRRRMTDHGTACTACMPFFRCGTAGGRPRWGVCSKNGRRARALVLVLPPRPLGRATGASSRNRQRARALALVPQTSLGHAGACAARTGDAHGR